MTTASAQGKINLVFQVGALSSGYHEVRSIYQAIDLAETVTVRESNSWEIEVLGEVPNLELVPRDESNIVVRAAVELARSAGITNPQPMKFTIQKRIPVAGGMAGGSADAAAALVALNEHWCLGKSDAELAEVGAKLGADVPFALLGGTALGTGTGTQLTKLSDNPTLHILLIFSEFALSTKDVFQAFDSIRPAGDELAADLKENYSNRIGENSLLPAALKLRPDLKSVLELDLGIQGGFLSGSGPTVWFSTPDHAEAEQAQQRARSLGYKGELTQTSSLGARLS